MFGSIAASIERWYGEVACDSGINSVLLLMMLLLMLVCVARFEQYRTPSLLPFIHSTPVALFGGPFLTVGRLQGPSLKQWRTQAQAELEQRARNGSLVGSGRQSASRGADGVHGDLTNGVASRGGSSRRGHSMSGEYFYSGLSFEHDLEGNPI